MSKKTGVSKPKGNRRASMKTEVFVPPHDPIRALGEWMDRQSRDKGTPEKAKKEAPPDSQCSIILILTAGDPQQLSEVAKKLKLLL